MLDNGGRPGLVTPNVICHRRNGMKNRFRTFRLRTLLAIVSVVCLFFAVRQHMRRYQPIAHDHHYSALSHGYHAMALQDRSFRRQTMETVRPIWERSIRHSQLADHYMQVTKRPWIFFLPPPDPSTFSCLVSSRVVCRSTPFANQALMRSAVPNEESLNSN